MKPRFLYALFISLCSLVAILITGCGKDEYKMQGMEPRRSSSYYPLSQPSSPTVTAGDEAVFGHDGGPTSLTQAIGGNTNLTGGSDHDYVTKADIFWKFHYLCNVINSGETPRNFADELRKIEMESSGIQSDSNSTLIMDILQNLKQGSDALKIDKKLKQIGLDPNTIPWGSGEFAISQFLNKQSQNKVYNWIDPDMKQRIMDFENNYHSPPAMIKQNSFQMANDETQELGTQLGLNKNDQSSPFGSNYEH